MSLKQDKFFRYLRPYHESSVFLNKNKEQLRLNFEERHHNRQAPYNSAKLLLTLDYNAVHT